MLYFQLKESTWNGFLDLKEKWSIISLHINSIPPTHLVQWQKMTSSLTENIQKFARWCLIYSLSKATNFQTWKLKKTFCFLCDHKETQIYLFSNFKSALNRYEQKYDSALKTLMNNIPSEVFELNADKDGYECPSLLFRSSRPQDPNANNY